MDIVFCVLVLVLIVLFVVRLCLTDDSSAVTACLVVTFWGVVMLGLGVFLSPFSESSSVVRVNVSSFGTLQFEEPVAIRTITNKRRFCFATKKQSFLLTPQEVKILLKKGDTVIIQEKEDQCLDEKKELLMKN